MLSWPNIPAVKHVSLLLGLVIVGGCFDPSVPTTAVLSCRAGADCPVGLFCLQGEVSRCISADAPCVEFSGREATAVDDGTACGDGHICIAAACVAARCGDAVVTAPETCDGDADCRADCTRCGDGVLDPGEGCDNGASNSDVQPGACRTTCVVAACGDGVRDPGEECDDGADNSGDGERGFSGDGGPAARAALNFPSGVDVDAAGRILIADSNSNRIRRVDVDGIITTIAGTGEFGFSGDGGPATGAALSQPHGVTVNDAGDVFIADTFNQRVRRVDVDGTITTIAGTGEYGFSGDGGPALQAALGSPADVAVDAAGRIFIAARRSASRKASPWTSPVAS